jgi:hypothetical protein
MLPAWSPLIMLWNISRAKPLGHSLGQSVSPRETHRSVAGVILPAVSTFVRLSSLAPEQRVWYKGGAYPTLPRVPLGERVVCDENDAVLLPRDAGRAAHLSRR